MKDLHSEKLHQNFHNPTPATVEVLGHAVSIAKRLRSVVDRRLLFAFKGDIDAKGQIDGVHIPKTVPSAKIDSAVGNGNQFLKGGSKSSSPPESVFIHLTPNRQRYSFRDEL